MGMFYYAAKAYHYMLTITPIITLITTSTSDGGPTV